MQTVTNFYISNLALSDVILAVFCIPFQFRAALMQRWDLPEFMCQLCPFMQTLSVRSYVKSSSVMRKESKCTIACKTIRIFLKARRPHNDVCQVNASVWTLVAICVDRYHAIVHPLAKKQSKSTAKMMICLIWLLGSVLALPMGLAHTFEMVRNVKLLTMLHSFQNIF